MEATNQTVVSFQWLYHLLEDLPKKSKLRRNFIDIAGYPSWENVNSNLLAFYFDKTDDHGFGTLFLDSLLELISGDTNKISSESDFVVAREVRTNEGNRIDIVINQNGLDESANEEFTPQSEWAIIIENKINHTLENNLVDYWNSVSATFKIGVVLSKKIDDFPIKKRKELIEKNIHFIHVSHKDLMEKVQQKLHQCFIDADDRHLLFLKEFIVNTNNFYYSESMNKDNEIKLQLFQSNAESIEEFKKQDHSLLRFVSEIFFHEFKRHGFDPNSESITKGKHFYADSNVVIDSSVFRFFVDLDYLRYSNTIYAYFELYEKKNTQFGSKLKEALLTRDVFTQEVKKGMGGNDNASYSQIYALEIPIGDYVELGYQKAVESAMNTHFWHHQNNFLNVAHEEFEKLISRG